MNAVDALCRYPLFALLGRDILDVWVEVGRVSTLQPGQTLLEEGTPGRHVCVLLRGRVRLSRVGDSGRDRSLGVLEAGTVFGEYALIPPHANTVTCRASEPSEVLLLPLSLLQPSLRCVRRLSGQLKNWLRLHALVHHFRHSAGLCFLTAPSLVSLLDRCREVTFGVAHTIQADGLLSDGWLFIQRGELLLHREDAKPVHLTAGDCFGEAALLGRARLPTAVALSETCCWHLDREAFNLPFDNPDLNSRQTVMPIVQERRWEWYPQRTPTDCGVAALTMAVRGQGLDVTFEELARHTPIGSAGANLADLAQSAQRVGMRTVAVRVSVEQLASARLPAVAHLLDGHFVTLFETRADALIVGDPAEGIRTISPDSFRARWSGNLLLLHPAK